MKGLFTLVALLLFSFAGVAQVQPKISIPPGREKSTVQPPLRGGKDLRPKQFTQNLNATNLANVQDIRPRLQALKHLKIGDSTSLPVLNIQSLRLKLKTRSKTKAGEETYMFQVTNADNTWLYVGTRMVKGKWEPHAITINPKYSDVLTLKNEGGKLFLSPAEQSQIVSD